MEECERRIAALVKEAKESAQLDLNIPLLTLVIYFKIFKLLISAV